MIRQAALLALLLQAAFGSPAEERPLSGSLVRTTAGRYVMFVSEDFSGFTTPYQVVRVNVSKVAKTNPRGLVAVTTLIPGQRKHTMVYGKWIAGGTFMAERVAGRSFESNSRDGSYTEEGSASQVGPIGAVRTADGLDLLPNFACYTSTDSRATCSTPPEGSDLDVFYVPTLQECCALCHNNPAACDTFSFAGQPILFGYDRSLEYPAGSCWMWRSDPNNPTVAPNLATDAERTAEDVAASLPPWRSYSFNASTDLIIDPENNTVRTQWYQQVFYNLTAPAGWFPRSNYEGYVPLNASIKAVLPAQLLENVGNGTVPVAYVLHTGTMNNYFMNATANEQYSTPETESQLGFNYTLESIAFNKTALGFDLPVAPFLWTCGYALQGIFSALPGGG